MASNIPNNTSTGGANSSTIINVQPPNFAPFSSQTQQAVATRGTPATLNLDDIFGDCFFTPEGDAVFLSETAPAATGDNSGQEVNNGGVQVSGENLVAPVASRPIEQQQQQPSHGHEQPQQQFVQLPFGGGISTTGLNQTGNVRATVMGAPVQQQPQQKIVPMQNPPQQSHHLQYATFSPAPAPVPTTVATNLNINLKAGRGSSSRDRKMSDQQKSERRERNREHAKRSRIRKKFLLESLQQSVTLLKEENDKLRSSIRENLGDATADELLTKENLMKDKASTPDFLAAGGATSTSLIASNSNDANKVLDDPDFSFIKALQTAQQNFVVTDPSLPDNPIVYATQGFLNLTGYSLDQVLGRNCRFLQGPETDPRAVEKIRKSIEEGTDMSVCLLNYRVDGTTFWNQFFIAALRDASGNITNYVGVQCKVSDQYAANVCKKQDEEDDASRLPTEAPATTTNDPTNTTAEVQQAQVQQAQPQVQMQAQAQPQAQQAQPQVVQQQEQPQVPAQPQVPSQVQSPQVQQQYQVQVDEVMTPAVQQQPTVASVPTPAPQVKTEENNDSNSDSVIKMET